MKEFLDVASLEWYEEEEFPGVFVRDILTSADNDQISVHYVRIEPGGGVLEDSHPQLELFYILKGKGEAEVGDRVHTVSAHTVLCAAPNIKHTIRNTGQEDIVMLAILSPPYV